MKKLILLATVFASLVNAQITIPRLTRKVETSAPQDIQLNLRRGETLDLSIQFTSYATVMDLTGATVTLHAITNGMTSGTSFQVSGTASSNGTASVRIVTDEWVPTTLSTGTWTMEVSQPSLSRIMRASGDLRVTGLVYPSAASPLSVSWATNLWTAIGAISSAVSSKVSTNDTTYLATVSKANTALQSDAVSNSNNWNLAFSWGNHAGLYLPISWLPSWDDMTNKPSTFTPSAHDHSYTAITNSPWALATALSNSNNWNLAFSWGNHAGLYLPLSGGTITGNLTVTGRVTATAGTIGGVHGTYTAGSRGVATLTPTNNADLFRVDVEPGANVTGMMFGRPGSVVPPGANGSYLCYIKAPASGTYNHALGLEAGKSNGEILHLYNKDQKHVARFNTDSSEELEVRWSRPDGQDQLYYKGSTDPYMTIGTGGLARAGSARLTVGGSVSATSVSMPEQIWSATGTNATYRMSWDITNGTFKVEEILP
jgi:hypothetical protein